MTFKLTIITINKNNADGLQRTIESVFSQTLDDFEYVIVDGASTDRSVDVIHHFENCGFVHLKWMSESDSGVYEAMNKGARMANGNYLLFLNSGDYFINNSVLSSVFDKEQEADILCGECNVSKAGNVIWTVKPPANITFGTLYHDGLPHQSTFIKKELLAKLGYYREDFKYNSDIEFWFKAIILHGASTQTLNIIVSDYNLEGISSKENHTVKYQEEMTEILSMANFDKFVPDYLIWDQEKAAMKVYYWAKSKKLLDLIISYSYKLAYWLNKKM